MEELRLRIALGACRFDARPGDGKMWLTGTCHDPTDRRPPRVLEEEGSVTITKAEPPSNGSAKILVAADGSEEATLAARTAADLAAKSGSELHVLTVAPEIGEFDQLVGMQLVGSYVESLQAIEQETRGILEEQAKNIEEAGGTVEDTHLEIGEPYPGVGEPPDRAIVHLSEDKGAALIVMGSRGHGGVRRAVMGSVSDSVVRYAHCPVLMMRRAQAEV